MLLTYTYVKGEQQMKKLLAKMGKDSNPKFNGSFAHVDDITIENIYERTSADGPYEAYYIFMMPHKDGQFHASTIRERVYTDIRNGAKNLKVV